MRSYALLSVAMLMLGCKTGEPSPARPVFSPSTNVPVAPKTGEPVATVTPPEAPTSPISLAALKEAAAGDAEFAANLYKASPSAGNRLMSPLSIRLAFAMTYAGAKGDTATEMQRALALKGEPSVVHEGFRSLLGDFAARAKAPDVSQMQDWQRDQALRKVVTLRVANRIWGQTRKTFGPDFRALLETRYAAPMEQLDFHNDTEGARKRINGWVEEKTEKKIKDLIPPGMLTPDVPLVLTNAVYFKAAWDNPFTESSTKQEDFFVDGAQAKKTAMMHSGGHRGYMEAPDAQVLELPYSDGSLSMIVVLPKSKTGLKAIEDSLSGAKLSEWVTSLKRQLVTHAFPKFKFEAGLPALVDAMKALGMKHAFTYPGADFSGIDGTHELFIGAAVHKTFIGVDEEGTEAAAATAVMMLAGSAPAREEPKSFVADHPFLFFIYDKKTATVLFLGRVSDPTKSFEQRK